MQPVSSTVINVAAPESPGTTFKDVPGQPGQTGCMEILAIVGSLILVVLACPVSLCFCVLMVHQYERAVIYRLGRIRPGGALGPGLLIVLPTIDTYTTVDLRTKSFHVTKQEVLTKDSVTITVDAVVFYRIENPISAVNSVNDYSNTTKLLAATTLRNVLGNNTLAQALSDRWAISRTMATILDEATDSWGVKVERVEIKDVCLPPQMQRSMAAEAEASREARAQCIAAEGELKASETLKKASDVIAGNPTALQLRYLQTLNLISAEKNTTIIFPLPIEIISPFLNLTKNNKSKEDEPKGND